ncbi:hypothetical protein Scep_014311 [Stephania cephalantha]|uniref:Uncharacterized protein n=1 Tax=Stephania cephalantha TaxID=152367 RepID=A0AAP0J1S1_9MAGN
MASYPHYFGRFEDSHCYDVNGENVSVGTLKNVEVNEVTQVEDYWSETTEGFEFFQIEPDIVIAQDEEEENDMKIEVVSERSGAAEREQGRPTSGVGETIHHLMHLFQNELPNLKDGMPISLPKYVDAPFVVDISKGWASRDESHQV